MNRRGMYFASLNVLIIMFIVAGYVWINEKRELENGMADLGKNSYEIIKGNLEAEKVRFFMEKSIDNSKNIALNKLFENGGLYCGECNKVEDYVIVDNTNIDVKENFRKYFSDSFSSYLTSYGNTNSNLNVRIEGNKIIIEGSRRLVLNAETFRGKGEAQTITDEEILSLIAKYSEIYEVPSNLIQALIMQESGGRVSARSQVGATGLMQIYPSAHPEWFDGSMCNGKTPSNDVECNIHAGTSILKEYYDVYQNGQYRSRIICKQEPWRSIFLSYQGWEAALRLYNGGQCGCKYCDDGYVETVLSRVNGEFAMSEVGTEEIDIAYEEEIDFDLNIFKEMVAVASNIRDCARNEDVSSCAIRHGSSEYLIYTDEKEEKLTFEMRKLEQGNDNFFKFALSV